MKCTYEKGTAITTSPLLGNGDLFCAMDVEGAILPTLPMPSYLPQAGLYRLGEGAPRLLMHLRPLLLHRGRPLGRPLSFKAELSTHEGTLTSVAHYARGVAVETRATVLSDRPILMITKKLLTRGEITLGYELTLPKDTPYTISADMPYLVGERTDEGGREGLCFFTSHPVRAEKTREGGRVIGSFKRGVAVSFFLGLAEGDGTHEGLLNALSQMRGYVYNTGEGRLFSVSASSFMGEDDRHRLAPDDKTLTRVSDASLYLLRVLGGGDALRADHAFAPLGTAPTVSLRVLSALLSHGRFAEAKRVATSLARLLPAAEGRFGGLGAPRARYPYYADAEGRECLPDDVRRGRVEQTAAAVLAMDRYVSYTGDRAFLSEYGYPVMRSGAAYLLSEAVMEDRFGTRVRCADLPECGAIAQRPLLSTAAVAAALIAYADTAERLGDGDRTVTACKKTAAALVASLPRAKGMYVAAEGEISPLDAPLYLPDYAAPLAAEPRRQATVLSAVGRDGDASPYRLALVANAYADIHAAALPTLHRLCESADVFGFLPAGEAEGMGEVPALFLSALCRSFLAHEDGRLHVGFGLDAFRVTDATLRLPLPGGATLFARVRDGALRELTAQRGRAETATLFAVLPRWLYSDGAAPVVKKTERGGIVYLTLVLH